MFERNHRLKKDSPDKMLDNNVYQIKKRGVMMAIRAEILINSPADKVWKKITDIEHSAEFITGIDKIEILEILHIFLS